MPRTSPLGIVHGRAIWVSHVRSCCWSKFQTNSWEKLINSQRVVKRQAQGQVGRFGNPQFFIGVDVENAVCHVVFGFYPA